MTDLPEEPVVARPAQTFAEAEDALLSRWPETRLEPSLDRIRAFTEMLGDPQHAYSVIHLTGTNGKTSTARMIDSLLRVLELRTGRFTSPHVEKMSERISIDGEPISDELFVEAFNDIAPYLHMVDMDQPHPMSFFESVVGMAYAKFAEAPVDVAIIEVGMGGGWDATNVADGEVAVITPIALDHAQFLGSTTTEIAREKAGIIKANATVIVAKQDDDVLAVLEERAAEVGARLKVQGRDFDVDVTTPAVGGQVTTIRGLRGTYEDLFIPLYGAHQAQNAALALAAVEAFAGGADSTDPIEDKAIRDGFAGSTSPGRLEVVRRSPTIVLDAAHNPHGAKAAAAALEDSFHFSPIVGVLGVMGDKDVESLLEVFEPHLDHVVITQNSQPRSMRAERLGELARAIYGEDRVSVVPHLADAIDAAAALAEGDSADSLSSGAVLITGSVVTVGEARVLLGGPK